MPNDFGASNSLQANAPANPVSITKGSSTADLASIRDSESR